MWQTRKYSLMISYPIFLGREIDVWFSNERVPSTDATRLQFWGRSEEGWLAFSRFCHLPNHWCQQYYETMYRDTILTGQKRDKTTGKSRAPFFAGHPLPWATLSHLRHKSTPLSRDHQAPNYKFTTNMTSNKYFLRIGHLRWITSNIGLSASSDFGVIPNSIKIICTLWLLLPLDQYVSKVLQSSAFTPFCGIWMYT